MTYQPQWQADDYEVLVPISKYIKFKGNKEITFTDDIGELMNVNQE